MQRTATSADLVILHRLMTMEDLMVQLMIIAVMMMHRLMIRMVVNVVQIMKAGRWVHRHERRVEELVQVVVVRRLISPFVSEKRMQIEVKLVSWRTVRRRRMIALYGWLVHRRRRRQIVVAAIEAVLAIVEVRIQVIVVIVRRVVLAIVERSGGVLFASISEK